MAPDGFSRPVADWLLLVIARIFCYGALAWLMLVAGKWIRWFSTDILTFAVLNSFGLAMLASLCVRQARQLKALRELIGRREQSPVGTTPPLA